MSKVTQLHNDMACITGAKLRGFPLDWLSLRLMGCTPDEKDLAHLTIPLDRVAGSMLEDRLKPFWTSKDEKKIALRVGEGREPWYVSPTRDKLIWAEAVIQFQLQLVPTVQGHWGAIGGLRYAMGATPGEAIWRCLLDAHASTKFVVPKILLEKDHVH